MAPRAASIDMDHTFTHQHRRTTDVRRYDLAVPLLGARIEHAGSAHLHPLRDAPLESAIELRLAVGEQRGQRAVGAASRGILGNTVERREHPGPNGEVVVALHVEPLNDFALGAFDDKAGEARGVEGDAGAQRGGRVVDFGLVDEGEAGVGCLADAGGGH